MGHWGTCPPLDFQLSNFSGHFRAAQTLPFHSMCGRWRCLINVSGCSTYGTRLSTVGSRSSVEQSSITRHCCPPLSLSSAVALNRISSHFLIPLSDSSLICTVPAQRLVILDTVIVFTFNISYAVKYMQDYSFVTVYCTNFIIFLCLS